MNFPRRRFLGSSALVLGSTLLDALETSSTGNVMTLSLAIPEAQLEQMIDSARAESHRAQAKPKKAPANQ